MDVSRFLDREKEGEEFAAAAGAALNNRHDTNQSMGIMVTGPVGCGKTVFVLDMLRSMGCEPVLLGAGGQRNKDDIEALADATKSTKGVLSMFSGPGRHLVTVIDEVEALGGGAEKGALTSLVKILRPKKTKSQLGEPRAAAPVVCIGQSPHDKKTTDLLRGCVHVRLGSPSPSQIQSAISCLCTGICSTHARAAAEWADGNLHRMCLFTRIWKAGGNARCLLVSKPVPRSIDDCTEAKRIVSTMVASPHTPAEHHRVVTGSERTVVSLLLHENVPDTLRALHPALLIDTYRLFLDVFAEADQLDKVTFQRQAWKLSELSSLLKNCVSVELVRKAAHPLPLRKPSPERLRFTRILTKYSTEHSNAIFLARLCMHARCTRRELLAAVMKKKDIGLSQLEVARLGRYVAI